MTLHNTDYTKVVDGKAFIFRPSIGLNKINNKYFCKYIYADFVRMEFKVIYEEHSSPAVARSRIERAMSVQGWLPAEEL